jgi:putative hydrolase of the HAD superfamily
MNAIRAILFDADGVIINPQRQFSRYLIEEHGIKLEQLLKFFDGEFNRCLLGQARLEDVLLPFLSEWGWETGVEEFIAAWMREDSYVDVRLLAAIRDLRRAGYLCGLATSQERRRAAHLRRQLGFERLFDRLYFSCELCCMKPDPEFYAKIERDLGLAGQEIQFWDDLSTNVEAARQRGWKAELYTTFDDFKEKLRSLP